MFFMILSMHYTYLYNVFYDFIIKIIYIYIFIPTYGSCCCHFIYPNTLLQGRRGMLHERHGMRHARTGMHPGRSRMRHWR